MKKIKIIDIPAIGLDVNDVISQEEIGLTKKDYIYFISPIEVSAHIDRVDEIILSKVEIKGRIASFCYRSLEKLEQDWQDNFDLESEIEVDAEFFDIGDEVRQEIILRLPLRILSEEEQKTKAVAKKIEQINKKNEEISRAVKGDEERKKGSVYRPFEKLKDLE